MSKELTPFPTDADTPFEEWFDYGRKLIRAQDNSLFALGDWLNYGKFRYDKKKYGSRYSEALEMLPYSYQALANIAFVCAHVTPAQRRMDKLLFAHHREISGYVPEKQAEWLGKAVEGGWSAAEMRRQIRAAAELANTKPKDDAPKPEKFSLVKWAMQGVSWMRAQTKAQPVKEWSPERRQAVLKDLQPAVDLYRELGGKP